MTIHKITVQIVLIDSSGQRTALRAPDSVTYIPQPYRATIGLPSTRGLIAALGLPSDTGHLTVGDYPTGVVTEESLVVHLDDTAQTRAQLADAGWTTA